MLRASIPETRKWKPREDPWLSHCPQWVSSQGGSQASVLPIPLPCQSAGAPPSWLSEGTFVHSPWVGSLMKVFTGCIIESKTDSLWRMPGACHWLAFRKWNCFPGTSKHDEMGIIYTEWFPSRVLKQPWNRLQVRFSSAYTVKGSEEQDCYPTMWDWERCNSVWRQEDGAFLYFIYLFF